MTPYSNSNGQYSYIYAKLISEGASPQQMSSKLWWTSKLEKKYLDEAGNYSPVNQYHFNAAKLNDFLTDFAKQKGINIIEDEIKDVLVNSENNISELIGEQRNYKSDFYIDCTGFKKLLISKLGAKWKSHGEYLKMKSTITFSTETVHNFDMWTVAKAMDYGWMFTIPTWGRTGNGYIFDSDYIDKDKAKEEVEKLLGKEIEVNKHFNFDPGALDKSWINNCVAIGLSSSFIEPLEATSIGTSIQQAIILVNKIINYNQKAIDMYNKSIDSIIENIRDYIALHYITKKTNSQFWKDIQHIKLPDSLQANLELWRYKLPVREDFKFASEHTLFKEVNYIMAMHGLGLFDKNSIRKEYGMNPANLRLQADAFMAKHEDELSKAVSVTHRQVIERFRLL